MDTLFGILDKRNILYLGILISILIPFSYFLIVLAQKIFFQVIMFRRINIQNMSKQELALFQEEQKTTLQHEFIWLILFQVTLEYANLVFLILTGEKWETWLERDIIFKIILSVYLWGFLIWYDYQRWRERTRTGKRRDIFAHCIHYAYTFWILIAVLFIVFQVI